MLLILRDILLNILIIFIFPLIIHSSSSKDDDTLSQALSDILPSVKTVSDWAIGSLPSQSHIRRRCYDYLAW